MVFKFASAPLEMVAEGIKRMDKDEASKYFRKLAIQLHPDKCSHPLAKEAF